MRNPHFAAYQNYKVDPKLIQNLAVGVIVSILAVFLGVTIADADYVFLALMIYVVIGMTAVVMPGTSALLAFGLLAPFTLPVPVVSRFPLVLLITILCFLKLFLSRLLASRIIRLPTPRLQWMIVVLFGWVMVRYAMNPALPNIAGMGSDVTGFRSYLHFGTSLILILGMPWFLNDRNAIERFVRWCGILSLVFSLILIPLSFTGSRTIAATLTQLGMFVTTFDNGMLRFVTLPMFGLMLISIALVPRLIQLPRWQVRLYLVLGMAGVILGGSRSGFLMLYALFFAVSIGQRRLIKLAYWTVVFVLCFFGFRYAGENLIPKNSNVGALRILAIASSSIAQRTDAEANTIWRQVRWDRAIHEIRNNPWVGKSYGGLDSAFVYGSSQEYEAARVEIDLASGNVHNGYLSGTLALGIPAGLLFITILAWQMISTSSRTRSKQTGNDLFLQSFYTFALTQLAVVSVDRKSVV